MASNGGILSKISRAFLLQGLLIAVAAILGVYFAKIVIEETLIQSAILEEADYFWSHHRQDPQFNLPDTKNLTGYFDPAALSELLPGSLPQQSGFYEYENGGDRLVLYLSRPEADDPLLYLLYYRGQVDALVLYYGLFPLLTALLILYLSLWLSYRFSHRAVSPIIRLAQRINRFDFSQKNPPLDFDQPLLGSDDEMAVLAEAIQHLGERLNRFVERERDFTRDASHELRSPLTVVSIAAEMLLSEQELSAPAQKSVVRIQRAVTDMQRLTEVFLLLAREDNQALTRDRVELHRVLTEEVERSRLLNRKQVSIEFKQHNGLRLSGSDMVLAVLFGNLIRNALLYTERGGVRIELRGHEVVVVDSGSGMSVQQLENVFKPYRRGDNVNASGYGIGMTIVKRLSERFGWPIEVTSELGEGTQIRVSFPEAELLPLADQTEVQTKKA